jgi:hypothetical protein
MHRRAADQKIKHEPLSGGLAGAYIHPAAECAPRRLAAQSAFRYADHVEGGHMKAQYGKWTNLFSAVTALAYVALVVPSDVLAQQKAAEVKKNIVGVWKLVSDVNTGPDGVVRKGAAFGPTPKGTFIFTRSGNYASVNTRPDIPKFAGGNRMKGTAEENQAVVQGTIAHFGTYSVSPDGKALLLKVQGGTWPGWVGTEQRRDLTLVGDDLKYSVVASIGGTSELVYKRVK